MKCRLLYLIGQLGPGGLERQLYYLLQSMDRERYRPEVVVWSFREDDTYMSHIRKLGVPLHSFPSTLSRRRKVLAFRGMIVRMQPEVIHSYSFHTNVAAWWAARGTNSIAIGSLRSDFVYDRKVSGFLLSRLSSRWPSMQIYNNQTAAERDRAVGGLFVPRQIFVVRNGVDLHLFRKVPLSMNGRVHISGVGTLLHVKRWDRLLRAASNLKKRGLDFQVEICGAGPLRERLEQEAETLGVMDRVAFIGHTDDVIGVLARSAFLVHTSDSEGCPNVVMEAMACGRAVVATDVGDIPDLVENGKTGFVVRCGDDATLAQRMATLIGDRDLCVRMGKAGQVKSEREFGLDRLVSKTLAAYQAAGWDG